MDRSHSRLRASPARAHLGVRTSISVQQVPTCRSASRQQDALMTTPGRVSHEADTSVRTREPPTEIMYAMYINLRCETEL